MAVVVYKMPPLLDSLVLLQQHYMETQGEIGCHRKVLVVGPVVAAGDVAVEAEAEAEDDVVVVDGDVGRGHWKPMKWELHPTKLAAVEAECAQPMPPIRPRREVVVEDLNPLDSQNRNPIELMMVLSPLPFVVMNWSDCPVID